MADLAGARLAFAGTPDFAVPTLEALLAAGARVPLVLTQPDRPAGRGRRLTPSPVKRVALAHRLAIEQPARLDDRSLVGRVEPAPDALIVVAYGLLLPQWLLDWPAAGCINIHASLLPRWRGAAPIQRALLAGDPVTGVSLMQMARGLDTGPVFATASMPIGPDDTAASLHDRLSTLGAELAVARLPAILAGRLEAVPQNDAEATYAEKLTKQEARIDWRAAAAEIERRVRAFNPWPVAETRLSDGRRLRVWESEVVVAGTPAGAGPPAPAPGEILRAGRDGIDVATGDGALRLTVVQADGGRAMPAGAWLASQDLGGLAFEYA